MTYVVGNSLTGFTLEIDGGSEAIERIATAIGKAISAEYDRAEREQRALWCGGPVETAFQIRRLVPFEGTVTLRTAR